MAQTTKNNEELTAKEIEKRRKKATREAALKKFKEGVNVIINGAKESAAERKAKAAKNKAKREAAAAVRKTEREKAAAVRKTEREKAAAVRKTEREKAEAENKAKREAAAAVRKENLDQFVAKVKAGINDNKVKFQKAVQQSQVRREENKQKRVTDKERENQIVKNEYVTTREIQEFQAFLQREIKNPNNIAELMDDYIVPNYTEFNVGKLDALINAGFPIFDGRNADEQSILFGANLEKAIAILERHIDVNNSDEKAKEFANIKDKNGKTALYFADPDTSKMLVDFGVDVYSKDKENKTVLFESDFEKSIMILSGYEEKLINNNSDVREEVKRLINQKDKNGRTALYNADPQKLELLVELGGNINLKNKNGKIVKGCSDANLSIAIDSFINDKRQEYAELNKGTLLNIKNQLSERSLQTPATKKMIEKIDMALEGNKEVNQTEESAVVEEAPVAKETKKMSLRERFNEKVKNYKEQKAKNKEEKIEQQKLRSKERARDYLIEEYFMQGKNIGDFYNDSLQRWGKDATKKLEPFQEVITEAGRIYALSLAQEILIATNDDELQERSDAVKTFCDEFKQGLEFQRTKVVQAYQTGPS